MINIADFSFARMPEIHFGPGKLSLLPRLIAQRGKNVLLVTGSTSFLRSANHRRLKDELAAAGIQVHHCALSRNNFV